MTKSARTRELLVETALRSFRERGYEATTMRLIAGEAGVSPGNAYYYFEGKESLVQELYVRIQQEHRERALPLLRDGDLRLEENWQRTLAGDYEFPAYHVSSLAAIGRRIRRNYLWILLIQTLAEAGLTVHVDG